MAQHNPSPQSNQSIVEFDRKFTQLARWFLCLLSIAMVGCGESTGPSSIERVGVEGSVTLDGRPLKAGAIVFHGPLSGDHTPKITSHAFIEDGRYHIDAADGPAIGTARVEVRPKPLPREEYEASLDAASKYGKRRSPAPTVVEIPERYFGQQSELRAELTGGKRNQHHFQLDSSS